MLSEGWKECQWERVNSQGVTEKKICNLKAKYTSNGWELVKSELSPEFFSKKTGIKRVKEFFQNLSNQAFGVLRLNQVFPCSKVQ